MNLFFNWYVMCQLLKNIGQNIGQTQRPGNRNYENMLP